MHIFATTRAGRMLYHAICLALVALCIAAMRSVRPDLSAVDRMCFMIVMWFHIALIALSDLWALPRLRRQYEADPALLYWVP